MSYKCSQSELPSAIMLAQHAGKKRSIRLPTMPILRALEAADSENDLPDNANQLILFDF